MSERRVPVQYSVHKGDQRPAGSITWSEHMQVWEAYHAQHPGQSAERIAERGGFGYHEIIMFLGHEPTTWQEGVLRHRDRS